MLAGGSGTLRTGEIAPHLRFVKTGAESSRIELANAGQLTVNRGVVFTMSLESLLDLRRPAVHCTRRPPRREQMACRFRPVDRNASAVLHIEKHLFSRARGDKNSRRQPCSMAESYRRAAALADRILKGARRARQATAEPAQYFRAPGRPAPQVKNAPRAVVTLAAPGSYFVKPWPGFP